MAKTFFRSICSIERSMKTSPSSYSADKRQLFTKVINFIQSGVFTDSESEKFICKNYSLSNKELAEKWNMTALKPKNENTFRGQGSTLSTKILSLFGCSADEFEEAFMSEGSSQLLVFINDIISAFEVDSVVPQLRYDFTLSKYLYDYDVQGDYSFSECQQELALLRLFDSRNLQVLFESVDKDKLAYLYRMMNADLIIYEGFDVPVRHRVSGKPLLDGNGNEKTRHFILPIINDFKVALYKQLMQTKPMKLTVKNHEEFIEKQVEPLSTTKEELIEKLDGSTALIPTIEEDVFSEELIIVEEDFISEVQSTVSLVNQNPYGLNVQQNIIDYLHSLKEFETKEEQEFVDFNTDWVSVYMSWLQSLTPSTLVSDVEDYVLGANKFYIRLALDELKNN